MSHFRKQWLNNLQQYDFVDSYTLRDSGFSVGLIHYKGDHLEIEFLYGDEKITLLYESKSGVFVAVKENPDNVQTPNLTGDQIIVSSETRIQNYISHSFYKDGFKLINNINELFDLKFNTEHPNPPTSDQKRIEVMAALHKLKTILETH